MARRLATNKRKRIAIVARDEMKSEVVEWAIEHEEKLAKHQLFGTGTTGSRIAKNTDLSIKLLLSGPLGGDQQLGAMIAEDKLDVLIFFTDPLSPMPHDVDVKALVRISTLKNVIIALNRATADCLIHQIDTSVTCG